MYIHYGTQSFDTGCIGLRQKWGGGGSFLFLLRLFHTGMQHNCMIQVFRVRNSTFEELSCA